MHPEEVGFIPRECEQERRQRHVYSRYLQVMPVKQGNWQLVVSVDIYIYIT